MEQQQYKCTVQNPVHYFMVQREGCQCLETVCATRKCINCQLSINVVHCTHRPPTPPPHPLCMAHPL